MNDLSFKWMTDWFICLDNSTHASRLLPMRLYSGYLNAQVICIYLVCNLFNTAQESVTMLLKWHLALNRCWHFFSSSTNSSNGSLVHLSKQTSWPLHSIVINVRSYSSISMTSCQRATKLTMKLWMVHISIMRNSMICESCILISLGMLGSTWVTDEMSRLLL